MKNKPNVKARMSLFDAVKESCWCFRWFHIHSFVLIIKSIFKPLILEDLVNTYEGYWPEVNYKTYGKIKTMSPSYSARMIIQKMFKSNLIIASILAIIDAGLGFVGPIIIKYILQYVNTPNQTDRQQRVAYALAGIWIALYFIKIFVSQYWQRICAGTGVCVQVTLMAQLYRKLSKVSYVYKKYISLGDFYGYLIVDISVITSMISQFANLFGAPVTLILSVIFVCIEVGPYGLLLLLVICLAILIQLYVDFMRASIYAQKLVRFENRLAQNIHLYSQFKTLRCLVWERMLVYDNIRYRVPQNTLNKMYYMLGQFYLFIARFSPYIIIFILFLIGFLNNEHQQWNSTVVYTVISYISSIKGPLNTLPNVIVSLFQSSKAFNRIDNFLEADDFQRVKDIYLPQGTVVIDNLVLNTGTRKSIERLIVRQSLYIGQQDSLVDHVQNLPIEVRTHQNLDDISYQDVEKFRKCLICLEIPFKLRFCKQQRLIILGNKSGSGKTSFLRSFLGLLNTQSGFIKYSGKLGFASADDDFYLQKSIRENVVFGQPLDNYRLERAYQLSGLDKQLDKFSMHDNTVVDQSSRILAPAQKCLISLARAIYYNSDILLLDEFFQQFDIDESIEVYNRICQNLNDKLIIVTTNVIHFLKPNDRIIILDNCIAVQEGTLQDLKNKQYSRISQYYVRSPILVQEISNITARNSRYQLANNTIIRSIRPRKTSFHQASIVQKQSEQSIPVLTLGNSLQSYFATVMALEPPIPKTSNPPIRFSLIQLRYYWAFFKTGGFIFLFVIFVVAAACAAETFATWIIGSASNEPFGFSYGIVIVIYACLEVGYGILLLVSGIFMPFVAYYNTQKLTNYFNAIIMKFKLTEMQKIGKMFLTFIVGYDYLNFYNLCDQAIFIFSGFVSLIATIVIMGLGSYYIWIIAGAILLYCLFVFLIYRRTQRQIFNVCDPIRVHFFRVLEDAFVGGQVFQFYDKIQWFRLKVFDAIYMFSAVWKNNTRFAQHGFSILIGIAQLILIAGIVFLAISRKPEFTNQQAVYVSVALSGAPTLMGIISSLLNNLSDMAGNLNLFLKVPAQTLRYKDEIIYDSPAPPVYWPTNGKIQLRNVIVEKPQLKNPLLNNINLQIPHGQIVGVYGDYDSDITTLFLLINRLKSPRTNKGGQCGEVLISNCNIQKFGQIYTTQHVILLDTHAPAFTGTLRYNVDPFGKYSDYQIQNTIKMVGFWQQFESNYENPKLMEQYGTLNFIIQQRGKQLKSSSLQKINLSRAILKKPKVLMMQYGLVKVNTTQQQLYYQLIHNILRDCTIIILTSYLHNLFHCDRVIGIQKGKIIQDGPPKIIASNPNSRLYKMLFLLSQSPSYEPDSVKIMSTTNSTKFSYGPY